MRRKVLVRELANGTFEAVGQKGKLKGSVRLMTDEYYAFHAQSAECAELLKEVKRTWGVTRKVRWVVRDEGRLKLSLEPSGEFCTTLPWYIKNLPDSVLRELFAQWMNTRERMLYMEGVSDGNY